ncbi:MAG: glycine--tRNA ligase, partial [archaeon]|nr:glycine--tRNA ligase [archaeon]
APAGFFDYANEGLRIRRQIIQAWREEMVEKEGYLELDGSTILPEKVFQASGHLIHFNDPMVVCPSCQTAYRADNLITDKSGEVIPEGAALDFFDQKIKDLGIACPKDNNPFGNTKRFNMMMKVELGVTQDQTAYLRPEACQNIFLDFPRIWKLGKIKLPIGLAQVGRAYRNEIAPRQGLLRTRELEHMDVEVFFNPQKINEVSRWEEVKGYLLRLKLVRKDAIESISCEDAVNQGIVSGKVVAYHLARCQQFFETLGMGVERMRFRELEKESRAFYASETWDFEVKLEEGWVELVACNYRTDYDLQSHGKESKQDLGVKEEGSDEKFIPHVFELSMGVGRTVFCTLALAYRHEFKGPDERMYLDLPPRLAPNMAGVFPLMKKDGLGEKAREIFTHLQAMKTRVFYDDAGSVGKR